MPLCGIRCRCSEMRRRPTARCVAMLRAYLVLSLVAVLFGAFVLAGCTDSNSPLPPLRAVDVTCLLYTSDAADDLLCVDLGGRRIIKKKKNKPKTRQNN